MADNVYPLPKFHFEVNWGGQKAHFSEVSGLEVETEVLEYRLSNSNDFSTIKMPGMQKYANVTLKRGVFNEDFDFYKWWLETKTKKAVERREVTISLLDENNEPAVSWVLKAAWPTKVTPTDLKSDGNEIAIETIELVHEGLSIPAAE